MHNYSPLADDVCVPTDDDEPIEVTVTAVTQKLRQISITRASRPDNLPNWVLKEYAEILAPAITDILNHSFRDCKVPRVWKIADVPPVPKAPTISDFNKDLRPISLTSTLSIVAEDFVIERELKPVLLKSIDPLQFGFIPGSCTTFALISMLHHWLAATDRTGSTVRVALLDFRKAFELVDHNLLIAKLFSYGIKPYVVNWIADFLRGRSQRVKINKECCSAFLQVPVGIPQGTKIGPWLFLLMINDLSIAGPISSRMWKFADDTTLCEVVPRDGISKLQDMVQQVEDWSSINMFQLNATKCKELRINFSKQKSDVDLVIANEQFFELVTSAKILGATVTDDLKWKAHVNNIVLKASSVFIY